MDDNKEKLKAAYDDLSNHLSRTQKQNIPIDMDIYIKEQRERALDAHAQGRLHVERGIEPDSRTREEIKFQFQSRQSKNSTPVDEVERILKKLKS